MNRERPGAANEPPSKSQRKRDARVLFDLGRELVGLDPARLSDMPLEPNLLEQIEIARGIRAHVARKRQLQFIAKLLRRMDTAPIEAAMGAYRLASRRQAARLHHIEAWRDSLLAGGDWSKPVLAPIRSDCANCCATPAGRPRWTSRRPLPENCSGCSARSTTARRCRRLPRTEPRPARHRSNKPAPATPLRGKQASRKPG